MSEAHLSAPYWLQVYVDLIDAPFEAQIVALGIANAALDDPGLELAGRLAVYRVIHTIFGSHGLRAARYIHDSSLVIDWRPLLGDEHVMYSIRHYVPVDWVNVLQRLRRGTR